VTDSPPRASDGVAPDSVPRRGFIGWLAALPVLGAAVPAARALLTTPPVTRPDRLPLCRLGDVPAAGKLLARTLVFETRVGPRVEKVAEPVFVGRRSDGTVYALSGRCTHVGCPVLLDEGAGEDGAEVGLDETDGRTRLRCPCHDASFDADGRVLAGPPRRPLPELRLALPDDEDGTIEVLDP
jgi:Rieske Fe-S protein